MFSPFRRLVEILRKEGATTPEKAITWKKLGLPAEVEHMSPPFSPDISPIVRVGNKYYLSEKRLKAFRKRRGFHDPLRKWIQHTAKVPKGYLRYRVLHKLQEGPMSGAELTSAIEEEMEGRWKPKPGSMYPLLKHLLQDGLTRELPDADGRTRRYELTEKGIEFLETKIDQSCELRDKFDHGFSPFPPLFLHKLSSQEEFPQSLQNLFKTLINLRVIMTSNPSPEVLEELAKAAGRFSVALEKIRKKVESQNHKN